MLIRLTQLCVLLLLASGSIARAAEVTITFPDGTRPRAAIAVAPETQTESKGRVAGDRVAFTNLPPKTTYDFQITLMDGTIFQGVNMNWYSSEPAVEKPEALTDDDRKEIRAIVQDVRGFYNRNEILLTRGNHDRATLLVQLVRDKAFHSDQGGEIIWHIELWYFKFQNGGWEKVQQQNRVLRRERFTSRQAFDAEVKKIRWVDAIGGVRLETKDEKKEITLPATAPSGPATNKTAREP